MFSILLLAGCSSEGNPSVDSGTSSEGSEAPGDTDSNGDGDGDSECTPGELDCECNGGLCLMGLECVDGICIEPDCIPGELGCACNDGLCLGDLAVRRGHPPPDGCPAGEST